MQPTVRELLTIVEAKIITDWLLPIVHPESSEEFHQGESAMMQPDIRRLMQIVEGVRIRNEGALGQLEQALNIWCEGDLETATPLLLALDGVAANYRNCDAPTIYRGMLVDNPEEIAERGLFEIVATRPLASWSTDDEKVEEFMFGWDRPWIMVECGTSQLDVFLDLTDFHEQAESFTQMSHQNEVIVRMPPKMVIQATHFRLYDQ